MPQQPRNAFIGRSDALRELDALVLRSPLATVVGIGGVGKTRLVLEWLRQRGPRGAQGVAVVRLDGLDDETAVLGAIAAAVDMPQTGGRPYAAAIGGWLQERSLLLVLDNCEHVAGMVAPVLEQLLGHAGAVTVLATSRRPLGLAAEALLRLAPLPVPAGTAPSAALAESAAVGLFVARARAYAPEFAASHASLATVAAICRAVDGLPLAIELAAGWAAALPVADIASQLDQGLSLLRRPGAQPERHAALSSALAWSHALLSPAAQVLLRRLAVFPAAFPVTALEPVCIFDDDDHGLPRAAVRPGLRELVEHSLVQFDLTAGRYRLLNTVRQFARDLLAEAGEDITAGDAHTAYARGLALQARAVNFVPEQEWLPRLLAEVDDLHAALRWLLARGRTVEALELAVALTTFWWLASRHREGIGWLQAALAASPAAPVVLRAAAHFGLGFLGAHDTGDWTAAADELDRGIALLQHGTEPGADLVRGYLLCLRGECDNVDGRPQYGLARTMQGAALVAAHPDDRWGQGFAAWNVGFSHEQLGDLPRAAERYEAVIASQRGSSSLVLMIGCQSLGRVRERQGKPAEALPLFDEALDLWRAMGLARLGDIHGSRAQALVDCARPRLATEPAQARALAQEAQGLADTLQDAAAGRAAAALLQALAGPAQRQGVFRRQGAVWHVGIDGAEVALPDSKGLRQLRYLLQAAGNEVPATELAQLADGEAHATDRGAPALDSTAVTQYRKRLRALEQVLALDDDALDDTRRAQARQEHQAISQELARVFGLRGRVRRLGSPLERMRVNVTRTLRAAIADIDTLCPALGALLAGSVKTGSFCAYRPREPVQWKF